MIEKCPKCGGVSYTWHELDTISYEDDMTCECFKCEKCDFIFDWITEEKPDCGYYRYWRKKMSERELCDGCERPKGPIPLYQCKIVGHNITKEKCLEIRKEKV